MFVTGESMNLDFNAISAMLQLLNKPLATTSQNSASEGSENSSPFAKINGIGEKVDISARKQQPAANPVASVLETLGGSGGGDMLSTLMPMLMNLGKKPERQSDERSQNSARSEKEATAPMQNSVSNAPLQNNSANAPIERRAQNNTNDNVNDSKPESNFSRLKSAEKFAPISFAGYALISALNRLYCHAHT